MIKGYSDWMAERGTHGRPFQPTEKKPGDLVLSSITRKVTRVEGKSDKIVTIRRKRSK